jgi:hypothetical protein
MSNLRRIAAIAVAVYLLLVLLDRFVLIELLAARIGLPLLLVAAEALAIVAVGSLVRRSRVDLPLDFIVGYPIFGTLLFLVGTVKINAAVMVGIVVIGAIAGVWRLRGAPPPSAASLAAEKSTAEGGGAPLFGRIAIAVVFLAGFVMAQAPPVSLDELAYHLAVPQTWVNEGRAIELPLLSHSYFPLGIESADLPLLAALGSNEGGIASHLLHLLAAIATTLLVARRTKSWLTTAAIVTTPALAITAGWSLVDWPLAGICVALYGAVEDDDDRTLAAALAAGMLTKYTFLPFAAIVIVLAKKWRPAIPGALVGSVFFIRNLILTGNPFAPFFGDDAPHVSGYRTAYLSDYVFDRGFVDEALGIALIALCVLARGRIAYALLAAGGALFFLAPSSRILIPFLLIPAITSAPAVDASRILRGVVAVAIAVQSFFVLWFVDRDGAFALLGARVSDEQYIVQQRSSVDAIRWIDQSLPPGARTLVIGLNETYWFAHPVRGGGNFDGERVSHYLAVPAAEALREKLRRDGITHVAVINAAPPTNVERKQQERQTQLTPEARQMLAQMLDHFASQVVSRGDDTLFTLK